MTHVSRDWEFLADINLLKLLCLQNKVFCTTGNFPRCALVSDLHTAYNLLYVYDYITKLCRHRSCKLMRIILFTAQGKVKPDTENIRGPNLVAVKLMTAQVTKLLLWRKIR
jgi:hypothetical protein